VGAIGDIMNNFLEIFRWIIVGLGGLAGVLWLVCWFAMVATAPFVYFNWLLS